MMAMAPANGAGAGGRCIVLIRHGQATGQSGKCLGHADVPLSPDGAEAIRKLAYTSGQGWFGGGAGAARLVSSDLERARASAAIVGRALGLQPALDVRLREMNFGEWDGRQWDEIEQTDASRFRTWADSWITESTPNGESVPDLLRRTDDWLAEAVHPADGSAPLIVVAHAGTIRAILCRLLRHPVERMFDLAVECATARVVRS
jgi:alpha-ribazole phosphatase